MQLEKYIYKSVMGDKEIKVTAEMKAELKECDRVEYNINHKETRRHYSYEVLTEEKYVQFEDITQSFDYIEEEKERERTEVLIEKSKSILHKILWLAFNRNLTPHQSLRYYKHKVEWKGSTIISKELGVDESAIRQSFAIAKKKDELIVSDTICACKKRIENFDADAFKKWYYNTNLR